jgi:hypothetical protein
MGIERLSISFSIKLNGNMNEIRSRNTLTIVFVCFLLFQCYQPKKNNVQQDDFQSILSDKFIEYSGPEDKLNQLSNNLVNVLEFQLSTEAQKATYADEILSFIKRRKAVEQEVQLKNAIVELENLFLTPQNISSRERITAYDNQALKVQQLVNELVEEAFNNNPPRKVQKLQADFNLLFDADSVMRSVYNELVKVFYKELKEAKIQPTEANEHLFKEKPQFYGY